MENIEELIAGFLIGVVFMLSVALPIIFSKFGYSVTSILRRIRSSKPELINDCNPSADEISKKIITGDYAIKYRRFKVGKKQSEEICVYLNTSVETDGIELLFWNGNFHRKRLLRSKFPTQIFLPKERESAIELLLFVRKLIGMRSGA